MNLPSQPSAENQPQEEQASSPAIPEDFSGDLEAWRLEAQDELQVRRRSWKPLLLFVFALLIAAGLSAGYWWMNQREEGYVLLEASEGVELFRDGVEYTIALPMQLQVGDRLVLQNHTAKLRAAGQDSVAVYPFTSLQVGLNKHQQPWLIIDNGQLRFTRPSGAAAVEVLLRTPQADITMQPFDAFLFCSDVSTQLDLLAGSADTERRNNFSTHQIVGGESLRISAAGFEETPLEFPLPSETLLFRLGSYHSPVPEAWSTHSVALRGTARTTGAGNYDVRDGGVIVSDGVSESLANQWAATGPISLSFCIRGDKSANGTIAWLGGNPNQPVLELIQTGNELHLRLQITGEEATTLRLGKNLPQDGRAICWHVELAEEVRIWNNENLIIEESIGELAVPNQLSPLILGTNSKGLEDWDGEIESFVIWKDSLSQGQVERNLAVRNRALKTRKRPPPLRVAAVLKAVSNVPQGSDAAGVQNALLVSQWEIAEAADDTLAGADILVLHWAYQDSQLQEAALLSPGLSATLLLEPLEDNPQLGSLPVYSDFEEEDSEESKLRRYVRVRGE
jgi:hypothetical protein